MPTARGVQKKPPLWCESVSASPIPSPIKRGEIARSLFEKRCGMLPAGGLGVSPNVKNPNPKSEIGAKEL